MKACMYLFHIITISVCHFISNKLKHSKLASFLSNTFDSKTFSNIFPNTEKKYKIAGALD